MKFKLMSLLILFVGMSFAAQRIVLCEEPNYSG